MAAATSTAVHATTIDDFDVGQVILGSCPAFPLSQHSCLPRAGPLTKPTPTNTEQVIGRGGFGLVYRARHRATGKEVALKVLDKRALHAEGMAHRVVNEVRLHARAASVQPQAQQKEQQVGCPND